MQGTKAFAVVADEDSPQSTCSSLAHTVAGNSLTVSRLTSIEMPAFESSSVSRRALPGRLRPNSSGSIFCANSPTNSNEQIHHPRQWRIYQASGGVPLFSMEDRLLKILTRVLK